MYESDSFFSFHPINAWEQPSETEPGQMDIVTDVPCYNDLDVLKKLYYNNMKSTSQGALDYLGDNINRARPKMVRWKLPGVSGEETISINSPIKKAERVFTVPSSHTVELPTFNPKYAPKPCRYIFGVGDERLSTFVDSLVKFDSETKAAKKWRVHAHSPGEAIFLPNPEGKDEDDGTLLSVVLDGTKGKSYLLVLDAKTFTEIGRAEMERVVPFGFHGAHIKN